MSRSGERYHRGPRVSSDALIIATGEELAVERILTADAGWRSASPLVELVE